MNKFNIKNVEVYGLENAARASGNPMRTEIEDDYNEKDYLRLKKLAQTGIGEAHDQALTGVIVQFDIYAPLYMWKQIQRYHFLDFISSQSTMHRLTKFDIAKCCVEETDPIILERYRELIDEYRELENQIKELKVKEGVTNKEIEINENTRYKLWRTLVASLPSGFVLGATLTTNYRQLKTIYHQRKNHKLVEWHYFCDFIKTLPHSELITGE